MTYPSHHREAWGHSGHRQLKDNNDHALQMHLQVTTPSQCTQRDSSGKHIGLRKATVLGDH